MTMKHLPTLLAALLLAPLAALHAADALVLQPPQYVGAPKAEQSVTNRAFTGIPSLAIAPKGRMWATWYAGVTPGEDHNNYVVLSTSGDGGATWNEVLVVDPDAGGPVRSFDPECGFRRMGGCCSRGRPGWAQLGERSARCSGVTR